jgi:hypothetical protein
LKRKKNVKKRKLCKKSLNKRHAKKTRKKISDARRIASVLVVKARIALEYLQDKRLKFGMSGGIVEVIPKIHLGLRYKTDVSVRLIFQDGSIVLIRVKNEESDQLQSELRKKNICLMVVPVKTPQREVTQIALDTLDDWLSIRR